jgi:hypothetical protein
LKTAAAAILDFLHFHFRFSFFLISRYVKYILAKFGENPIDSTELAAYFVKFKMAAVAFLDFLNLHFRIPLFLITH